MEDQNLNVNTEETKDGENKTEQTVIDYEKLEEMINKGLQVKENGILKSYFSQCGLSEDEAKEAIEAYKKDKESKAKEAEEEAIKNNPEIAELKKEIETLKSAAQKEKINNAIQRKAFGMGLNEKAINAMLKIQSFDVIENGNISDEKIDAAIQDFLNEYEVFKPNTQKNGFEIEVGANKEPIQKETEFDAMLRAIGLSPDKK